MVREYVRRGPRPIGIWSDANGHGDSPTVIRAWPSVQCHHSRTPTYMRRMSSIPIPTAIAVGEKPDHVSVELSSK
ncbi:MAG TPA: hypothetical protein VGP95_02905, partial [Gemmatimonadaceae bacterium]|nr:hypothetical protein [Gemmatimonadaceae bacterium]